MNTLKLDLENYKELLQEYIKTEDEQALYQAEQFSKHSMQQNISPEEIINVHIQSLQEIYPDMPRYIQSSMNFLLETMISYGLAYQEYQTLREKQLELKSEISVAANMQKTLLSTVKPDLSEIDVGALSVPAKQMNGDYHHFVHDGKGSLGIAVADVIGKGVPAALCMSMIKYSMDSFSGMRTDPSVILGSLNRVVERNVDASMFITMFYGLYNSNEHTFTFSSAGHEPGYYYHKDRDEFEEIDVPGLVLGVSPEVTYKQYEKRVEKGDMIILLTDGVTECRQGDRFIDQEEILHVIKQYSHLPAQGIVDQVYKHFERLQDFQLRDDFTLIILRRNV
ncbi:MULTISPECIES: PP2C family protein-serine/threonine phosphatase [Halobacillus]|uniref:Phosphoserine phosphatase n=3 Tax=Halobacillus TaxID=45667 RepID=A0A3D8VME1_9BACI|nr:MULTISPECIES: PP2C family protein-serine/threonine phosphatase [Halobacillus]MBX0359702.1 PP2C family protein-serine/threonine phosphatase [Halobacillus sp. Nhm2S1]RDY70505.1 phosphoserine phosphatase [Halobacillus trueperi]REJ06165.1 phosphoserine phosphatase [Halobacillus trueperi]SDP66207.1 sigma-B regulation protein RsbU (phosphoserine phosphatase) [Halobacillus aidingensis]GEN55057.1 phosphoserine phosphatase RsbU [Halobacillus faecis]